MKKIVVNSNPQNLVIDFDEVLYITILGNKTVLFEKDGKEKRLSISLHKLYEKIESIGFVRCHKSYIVNVDCIEAFNKSICTLKNGDAVPLGRKYYKEFKKAIYN
ncbi:LytTR family DNA-binding domain-containing protein (plasmid) [Clostridium baratii]